MQDRFWAGMAWGFCGGISGVMIGLWLARSPYVCHF